MASRLEPGSSGFSELDLPPARPRPNPTRPDPIKFRHDPARWGSEILHDMTRFLACCPRSFSWPVKVGSQYLPVPFRPIPSRRVKERFTRKTGWDGTGRDGMRRDGTGRRSQQQTAYVPSRPVAPMHRVHAQREYRQESVSLWDVTGPGGVHNTTGRDGAGRDGVIVKRPLARARFSGTMERPLGSWSILAILFHCSP